jgi:hypothetical protein
MLPPAVCRSRPLSWYVRPHQTRPMRPRLLLLATLISASASAIGPEACSLVGVIQGRPVSLKFMDFESYGAEAPSMYAYCRMGAKEEGIWYMRCTSEKGGKTTAYYETYRQGPGAGEVYVCQSGCGASVVQRFRLECAGG